MSDPLAPDATGRVQRFGRLGAFALLVLVVASMSYAQLSGVVLEPSVFRSGDTNALTAAADVAHDCLRQGTFRSCGRPADPLVAGEFEAPMSRVDRFPSLLYIPTVATRAAGFDRAAALRVIGILNAAAFVLLVAVPWLGRRRLAGLHHLRFLWVIAIVCSPLLPYAASTWPEVLGATLVVGAVAGVAARWKPWWVALLALGAGLSKETLPFFVVLLAFAVAEVGRASSIRTRLRSITPVLVGSGAAVIGGALFNLFRFGTPKNLTYLAPFWRVTEPQNVVGQLLAVLFSWNGGLLIFWPTLLLPIGLLVLAVRRADADTRLRLAVVVLAFSGFALGIAMWYSPFGWHAWGPRLMLPIVPGVVAATMIVVGDRVVVPDRLWAVTAVAVVLSVPNVAVLTAQGEVTAFMNPARPCLPDPGDRVDPFVRCTMEAAWRQRPLLVPSVLPGLGDPRTAALAVLAVGAGLGCAAAARREQWREGRMVPPVGTSSGSACAAPTTGSASPGAS